MLIKTLSSALKKREIQNVSFDSLYLAFDMHVGIGMGWGAAWPKERMGLKRLTLPRCRHALLETGVGGSVSKGRRYARLAPSLSDNLRRTRVPLR
jgi:hypothetical protein